MPTLSKQTVHFTNKSGGVGPKEFDVPEPSVSPDECAHALGVFMWNWDHLSAALAATTEALVGTDSVRAHIMVESVQHSAIRDLLRDVASHYLTVVQFQQLSVLLNEVSVIAGVRNRIVHGRWTLMIKMENSEAKSSEWARVFTVTDKETLHTMHNANHQKSKHLKHKYQYSATAILDEAARIPPVAERLRKLAGELDVRPDHPPEPRTKPRSDARGQKKKPRP